MIYRLLLTFALGIAQPLLAMNVEEFPEAIKIVQPNTVFNPVLLKETQGRIVYQKNSPDLLYFQINGYSNQPKTQGSNLVEIFNTTTNEVQKFTLPSQYNYFKSMSIDNKNIFIGGGTIDEPIMVLNKATLNEDNTIHDSVFLDSLIPTANGELIAKPYKASTGWPIYVFKDQKISYELKGDNQYAAWTSIDLSADEKTLVASSTDGYVWLFDLETKQATKLKGHNSRVMSARFSPNGFSIASVSENGELIVWDAKEKKASKVFSIDIKGFGFNACAWRGENYLALGDYWWGRVLLIDVSKGESMAIFSSKNGCKVDDIQFNEKGDKILVLHEGDFLKLWGLENKEETSDNQPSPPPSSNWNCITF